MKVSISAGTAILYKNKILLCHPTTLPWVNSFSPPKGGIDNDETLLEAALRETSEEVGIHLDVSQISNPDDPIEVLYISKKGELFKKAYIFIVKIKSLSEIDASNEVLDKSRLQASEVDWAGFMTKEEADNKIFFRFKPLLNLI
jgi:8-oxo-dGTP pyrophosphatase MutT (NUDIX family)